uniref:NAD-dependent epimerase/dehydratase domain-containing protein n=1 Tax=Octactis speculum TaxID=3111310 RepID=A0A7S2CH93_9STRA|mmetsp:Transcript_35946/g.48564  ORF Transcript_35946/g.48564 Transcript_35946/m.48564 type:complete len:152 (+) Transcript_35946:193-648(+)
MRRVPLFLLPNDGLERFQPIHVRDMAALMVELGQDSGSTNLERDACGPDAPTALELFRRLKQATGAPAHVMAPGFLRTRHVTFATQPINWLTGDVLLDTDDLDLMCSGLTTANNPSDPSIKNRRSLFDWLDEVGDTLGRTYVSSMDRYYKK